MVNFGQIILVAFENEDNGFHMNRLRKKYIVLLWCDIIDLIPQQYIARGWKVKVFKTILLV